MASDGFMFLSNLPSIGEQLAQAILDMCAHLDRDLTLLDLTFEVCFLGDLTQSVMIFYYNKLIETDIRLVDEQCVR